MKEIPPIPAPEVGDRFLRGLMECTVTSVWKSRFDDWKVSFKDSARGGGCTSLEYFNDHYQVILENRACYLIERAHPSRPGKWKAVGEFVAGAPWRDGRPVNDETMREEVKGYRMTWPDYIARVRCPNGEILSENNKAT